LLGCGWMEDSTAGSPAGPAGDQGNEPPGNGGRHVACRNERTTLAAIDLRSGRIAATHANPTLVPGQAGKSRPIQALGAPRHARLVALSAPSRGGSSQTTLKASAAWRRKLRMCRHRQSRTDPTLPGQPDLMLRWMGRPLEPGRGSSRRPFRPNRHGFDNRDFPLAGRSAPGRFATAKPPACSARTGTGSCGDRSRRHRRCIMGAGGCAAAPASPLHRHRPF
jgi:hypothetical protein